MALITLSIFDIVYSYDKLDSLIRMHLFKWEKERVEAFKHLTCALPVDFLKHKVTWIR